MNIQGSTVLVTGGASGLGKAVIQRFHSLGANVVIVDLNQELGEALAQQTNGLFIQADVSNDQDAYRIFELAQQKFGKVQILVNCAGIGTPAKVIGRDGKASPLQDFSRIVQINLIGTFNLIAKFAEQLHATDSDGSERGVVINTASVAAFDGQIGQPAYAASKAGVVGMTLPLAREFARYRIRVMTIAPGLFKTPLLAGLPQEAQDSLGQQVPFPSRLGEPEEFAQLVESIVNNPMLNGEVIRLDGAIRMAAK